MKKKSISRLCILLLTLFYISQTSALKIICDGDRASCAIKDQDLTGVTEDQMSISLAGKSSDKNNIKTVQIKNCTLPFVPIKLLKEDFRELKNLKIENCTLQSFQATSSPKLKIFSITHSDLESLRNDSFKDWTSLEQLDMSNNKISEIDPGTFDPTTNLKNVNFANNYIKELPNDLFSKNKKLEDVDFSNNQIEKIRNELFGNPSALKNLNFYNNQMNAIGPKFYNALPSDIQFDLTQNACINSKLTKRVDPKDLNNCFLRYRLDDSKEYVDEKLDEFGKHVKQLLDSAKQSSGQINNVNDRVVMAGSGIGGLVIFVMAFVIFTIFKSRNNKVAPNSEAITTKPIVNGPSTSKSSHRNEDAVVKVETSTGSSSSSRSSSESESEPERHKHKGKFSKNDKAMVHYKKGKR